VPGEDFGDVRAERVCKYSKQIIGVIHNKVGVVKCGLRNAESRKLSIFLKQNRKRQDVGSNATQALS